MANYNGMNEQADHDQQDEGKYLLDFAAYPSFLKKQRNADKPLTTKTRVTSANGQFQPTHATQVQLKINHREVSLPPLRYDHLKHQLISTHDLIKEIAPIVLLDD